MAPSLWSIDQYFEFVLVLMLSTGLAFQVPVIQVCLSNTYLTTGSLRGPKTEEEEAGVHPMAIAEWSVHFFVVYLWPVSQDQSLCAPKSCSLNI